MEMATVTATAMAEAMIMEMGWRPSADDVDGKGDDDNNGSDGNGGDCVGQGDGQGTAEAMAEAGQQNKNQLSDSGKMVVKTMTEIEWLLLVDDGNDGKGNDGGDGGVNLGAGRR